MTQPSITITIDADAAGELADDQARTWAQDYQNRLLDALSARYPEARIEILIDLGISGGVETERVYHDDPETEDAMRFRVHDIVGRVWQESLEALRDADEDVQRSRDDEGRQ